jgi:hypothetical protein
MVSLTVVGFLVGAAVGLRVVGVCNDNRKLSVDYKYSSSRIRSLTEVGFAVGAKVGLTVGVEVVGD